MKVFNYIIVFTFLIATITIFISDQMIRNEFELVEFNQYLVLFGIILNTLLFLILKRLSGDWIWKTLFASLITIVSVYLVTTNIAERLEVSNRLSIESKLNEKTLFVFYGLYPTIIKNDNSSFIKIKGTKGTVLIYDKKNMTWKYDG